MQFPKHLNARRARASYQSADVQIRQQQTTTRQQLTADRPRLRLCRDMLFTRKAAHLSILANDKELPSRRDHAVEDGNRVELVLGLKGHPNPPAPNSIDY